MRRRIMGPRNIAPVWEERADEEVSTTLDLPEQQRQCLLAEHEGGGDDSSSSGSSSNESSSSDPTGALLLSSTFWSNLSFLTGSCLYFGTSVWDVVSPLAPVEADDDQNHSLIARSSWTLYDIVTAAGPLLYVINAGVDFQYTFRKANQQARRRYWELAVTTMFGVAAIMDMAGTLVYGSGSEMLDYFPSTLAVHLYLVQSILTLWGGSYYDYDCPNANRLLQGGDIMFLVGSFIDVVISYLSILESEQVRKLEYWSLLSSSLWLLDALLYIVADVVDRYHNSSTALPSLVEGGASVENFENCNEEVTDDSSQLYVHSP
jgi:hypothetical protein